MDLIKTPSNHGWQVKFLMRFRDVLLVLDAEDKMMVEKVLKENMGTTWDKKMKYGLNSIWKQVKRRVREPCSLFTQLKTLFLTFGPMKCSVTGSALFYHVAWNQVANILHSVNLGHIYDPPDVVLYMKMGIDKYGLQKYDCLRGTNSLEGGIHGHMIKKFGSYGAGPALTDNPLAEFNM
ncbi:hypothetical protein INT47_001021 [Mucor saturninus]|uniref:Uncharacterized protein n=1 Tax=Mucor saturninus TaxID=64648 RepID=A0A8H7QEU5_9FUNG|nr:hypothetical protein INT47_001021 [Mucor saturninus]